MAALLNVQDDHVGVDGIETLEAMAELKAEVLERATGAIVVNAEDPLFLRCGRAGTDRHILVARSPDVDAVVEHRRRSGEAVFLDQRDGRPWIILATGDTEEPLMPVHDIPATMNGLLAFNESNAMFAAAVAWAQGIDTGIIRRALGCFNNTADENRGATTSSTGCRSTWSWTTPTTPMASAGVLSCERSARCRQTRALQPDLRHPTFRCPRRIGAAVSPRRSTTSSSAAISSTSMQAPTTGTRPGGAMLARYRQALLKKRVDASRITASRTRDRDPHRTRPGQARRLGCPAGRLR